jgi:hypothetical protein
MQNLEIQTSEQEIESDHSNLSDDDWSLISSFVKGSRSPETTFSEIVWQLQKFGYHTISIEPIFHPNLLHRFLERVDKFRKIYQYPHYPSYSRIDIVFHGTPVKNIPNIVQQGFLLPHLLDAEVAEEEHSSEHGQKWGPGIYFTKSHDLAALYGDDEVIIMCAVVMGRQFRFRNPYPRDVPGLRRGFDSHVSADGLEGVVFREDQILPLCVLSVKETEGFEWWETEEYERLEGEEVIEMMREELYRYQEYRRDSRTH